MTPDDLLGILAQRHVELYLDDGRLSYRAPAGALTCNLRNAISVQRAEIIRRLQNLPRGSASERCRPTCDPRDWRDSPPGDGRIRTTCGKCDRFIGFRPAFR